MFRLYQVVLFVWLLPVYTGSAAWYRPVANAPFLMIGHGWATVKEERIYTLQHGQQQIVITNLPETLELPTFTLTSRRFDLSVREWRWAEPAEQSDLDFETLIKGLEAAPGKELRWTPAAIASVHDNAVAKDQLTCDIVSPVKGMYSLEHLYFATGFDWEARYRTVVHSRLDRVDIRVSLDLEALVRLFNNTSCSYTNAKLLLCESGNRKAADSDDPGFLLLNYDSPLSRLGPASPPTTGVPHLYPPEGRFTVPAHSEVDVPLFARERLSAEQIFLFSADNAATGEVTEGGFLRRVLEASPSGGASRLHALPEGPLQIRAAGSGLHAMRQAVVRHTPKSEPIMLDLGEDQNTIVHRILKEKKSIEPSVDEHIYEWSIQNRHEWPIQTRIEDIPPVPLEWTLTRSTEPAEQDGSTLIFSFSVPAKSEYKLRYHIQVETPAL